MSGSDGSVILRQQREETFSASSKLKMNLICSSTLAILISGVHAFVNVGRSPSLVSLQNDRLFVLLETNRGVITNVTLDGANLLGQPTAPHNAIGPYLDTYGIRGNFAPGSQANYSTFQGVDTTGVAYVGMVMSEAISEAKAGAVGETMEQYWFLRDGVSLFTPPPPLRCEQRMR